MPATVVMVPAASTLRITHAPWSTTYKPPPGIAKTAPGCSNVALVAGPPSPLLPKPPVPATPATRPASHAVTSSTTTAAKTTSRRRTSPGPRATPITPRS